MEKTGILDPRRIVKLEKIEIYVTHVGFESLNEMEAVISLEFFEILSGLKARPNIRLVERRYGKSRNFGVNYQFILKKMKLMYNFLDQWLSVSDYIYKDKGGESDIKWNGYLRILYLNIAEYMKLPAQFARFQGKFYYVVYFSGTDEEEFELLAGGLKIV
jgi:hypothetical protein